MQLVLYCGTRRAGAVMKEINKEKKRRCRHLILLSWVELKRKCFLPFSRICEISQIFCFRTNFSEHHSNMIILFFRKTFILYFKICQNLMSSIKFHKIVPSFNIFCLVDFRDNLRENGKTKIFISTNVRGRGYPQPICDNMFNDDISVYSLHRIFPIGYCPPVGEKWESKLCFHDFFGMNSSQ